MDGVKLVWSVCVPDSCHSEDVFPHFNKSIAELTEGLGLVVSLREEHCNSLADEPAFDVGDYLVMSFIGIAVLAVFAASLIDYRNKGKSSQLISILSAYSNGKRLFSTTSKPGELECLHGLRYISICYVVTGHRYIQNMVFPTANGVDFIYWIQQYFSTLVIGGTVSVDTFFLIGSILVSYNFFQMVEKTKKISLIQFYLYRNLRLTMPLLVVVAIYSTLLKHFGNGPTWYDYSTAFQKPCQYFWWSTLLHIQSYINPETMCIVQTWYLTDDVLFYYFSPLIIIPLWKFSTFGFINWIVIYILSIISSFWVAWINQFDGAMPITSRLLETKYFQKHYIVPHTRASPYIIGLAFGYALFKTRGERIQISPIVSTLGWIFCTFCLTSVLMLSHIFHVENYEYNRLFSSLFLSCSRSVWTVGLMWIIFCCVNGNAGVLGLILSHSLMKILGRTVYSILLLHYMFQSSMQASRKTPQYFSDATSIYMACSDILLMTILGIPFTLCFEYPSLGLASLLLRSGEIRKVKPAEKGGVWSHMDK